MYGFRADLRNLYGFRAAKTAQNRHPPRPSPLGAAKVDRQALSYRWSAEFVCCATPIAALLHAFEARSRSFEARVMAEKKDRRGPEWNYVTVLKEFPKKDPVVQCMAPNCGKKFRAGATRIRAHLLHVRPALGVGKCQHTPPVRVTAGTKTFCHWCMQTAARAHRFSSASWSSMHSVKRACCRTGTWC